LRLHARVKAAVLGLDQEADFAEGHELGDEIATWVPANLINRSMPLVQAHGLIRHLERADPIPKRPPALSIRRRRGRAPRASTQ
jgi:hypothetical protein